MNNFSFIGELLALTLNDFDFEAMTVSIGKNYTGLDKQDLILEPKTPKSKRTISISPFPVELVRDYACKLCDYEAEERRLVFYALLHFRNKLIAQDRYTDAVDEVMIKVRK